MKFWYIFYTFFDSYQWFNLDGAISGETNASLQPALSQEYYCRVSNNGCFGYSDTIFYTPSGIEYFSFTDLKIFPNPTNGLLNIEIKEKLTSIVLKDLTGKTIQEFEPASKQINVSEIAKGIYFLELSNALNTGIFKIVKQ